MCASTSVVSTPSNRRYILVLRFHPPAPSSIFIMLKFKRAHFKIYGIWPQAIKQASKQASLHTHVCNAVMLVWGSLRLTPSIDCNVLRSCEATSDILNLAKLDKQRKYDGMGEQSAPTTCI